MSSATIDARLKKGLDVARHVGEDAAGGLIGRHVPEPLQGVARLAVSAGIDAVITELLALLEGSGRVDVVAGEGADVEVDIT